MGMRKHIQRTTNGAGFSQVGSRRAANMLYEESKDAFEAVFIRDLKGPLDGKHVFKRKAFNRERFSLLIWQRPQWQRKRQRECLKDRRLRVHTSRF